MTDVYQTHQELALNTTNPMTNSASTTDNEQPYDNTTTTSEHTRSPRQLIQKRNSAPNEDRQTKRHQQDDQENGFARSKNNERRQTVADILRNIAGHKKQHFHHHDAHTRQDWHHQVRQTCHCPDSTVSSIALGTSTVAVSHAAASDVPRLQGQQQRMCVVAVCSARCRSTGVHKRLRSWSHGSHESEAQWRSSESIAHLRQLDRAASEVCRGMWSWRV